MFLLTYMCTPNFLHNLFTVTLLLCAHMLTLTSDFEEYLLIHLKYKVAFLYNLCLAFIDDSVLLLRESQDIFNVSW